MEMLGLRLLMYNNCLGKKKGTRRLNKVGFARSINRTAAVITYVPTSARGFEIVTLFYTQHVCIYKRTSANTNKGNLGTKTVAYLRLTIVFWFRDCPRFALLGERRASCCVAGLCSVLQSLARTSCFFWHGVV